MSTQVPPILIEPKLEQPKFLEMPNPFNFDLWKSFLRQMAQAHGRLQWEIGDCLVEGKEYGQMGGKKLRQEAEKATKREWGTLKNYMVTARAIPPSRRRDGNDGRPELPFSLHVVVGKFEEVEHQERLLRIAGEGFFNSVVEIPYDPTRSRSDHPICNIRKVPGKTVLTVNELKSVIATMQDWGQLPSSEAQKRRQEKAKEKWHALKIRISDDSYARLERLSNAKYGRPYRPGHPKQLAGLSAKQVSNLVFWMAAEYYKEHKPELEAMIAAVDAKDAADKEEKRKRVEENEAYAAKIQEEQRARLKDLEEYDKTAESENFVNN